MRFEISDPLKMEKYIMKAPINMLKNVAMLLFTVGLYVLFLLSQNPIYRMMQVGDTELA